MASDQINRNFQRSMSPQKIREDDMERQRSERMRRDIPLTPTPQVYNRPDIEVKIPSPVKDDKINNWKNENCNIQVDSGKILGKGSFGGVYALKNDPTKVVKISNTDIVEACILKSIKHPYLLSAEKVILPYLCDNNNNQPLKEIQIILPKADFDGFAFITHSKPINMRMIVMQTALGLKALHDAGFIHRDLKPENILFFRTESRVKIADFGLSSLKIDNVTYNTNVVTTNYKAPELLVNDRCAHYTDKIDVFALGLTWLVMMARRLFFTDIPREKQMEYWRQKYDMVGDKKMKKNIIVGYLTHNKVFDNFPNGIDMEIELFIDLIRNMTAWNPNERYSMDEVLKHGYMAQYGSKTTYDIADVQFTAIPPYNTTMENTPFWQKTIKRVFDLSSTTRREPHIIQGSINSNILSRNVLVRNITACFAFELLLRSRQSPFDVKLDDLTIAASVYLADMVVFPVSKHVSPYTINEDVVNRNDRAQTWIILQSRIVSLLQSVDFNIFSDTIWQRVLVHNMQQSQEVPLMRTIISWSKTRATKNALNTSK